MIALMKNRNRRGFTLLEIMLVVGIIAILVGGVAISLQGHTTTAKIAQAEKDMATVGSALATYMLNNMNYPTTSQGLKALVEKPGTEPVPRRWQPLLKKFPNDPWGKPFVYVSPGTKNPDSYDIFSAGPDRKEGTDDDVWPQ
jgi:general secretion pathway protein G